MLEPYKANKNVTVAGPRGTREPATVKGITRAGLIVVQCEDREFRVVNKEELEATQ